MENDVILLFTPWTASVFVCEVGGEWRREFRKPARHEFRLSNMRVRAIRIGTVQKGHRDRCADRALRISGLGFTQKKNPWPGLGTVGQHALHRGVHASNLEWLAAAEPRVAKHAAG